MEYNFTPKEKEFIKQMNFNFEVNKHMTEEQLLLVIDEISHFIKTKGIDKNYCENKMGKIAVDILTKMAHEDEKQQKN